MGVDEARRDDRAAEAGPLVRLRLRAVPTAATKPSSTRIQPSWCSVPASSIVSTCASASRDFIAAYRIFAAWRSSLPAPSTRRCASKSERPDARPIAGGTDLLVELNFDRARPETILNLAEVPELKGWARENGALRLGGRPHLHGGDAAASSPSCCPRSPRRRAPSARRRSATAARSAATSAPPRRGRRAPAAARRGRDGRDREHARRPHAAADRVLPRPEAERARGGRARARGPGRAEPPAADVHEGRAAERDGDRRLLARRRSPTASAASCAPPTAPPGRCPRS